MWTQTLLAVIVAAGLALTPLAGCEELPGEPRTQSAVIGGVGGAAAGAMIGGEENRLVGALIGGALGAGGGYLIGGQFEDEDDEELAADAQQAVQEAQQDPATAREALAAETADINQDDFVTIDEIVAMEQAGISDAEMIDRLQATGQVFDLSPSQEDYLLAQGVSPSVVNQLRSVNEEERVRLLQDEQM
ncbi:MAG: YMGG-like glycine zipper-containing protein [Phycisphaeraceae bacterium]